MMMMMIGMTMGRLETITLLLMIMIETWSRALMEKAWTCLPMIIVVRLIKKMMIEMMMMLMISADAKLLILEEKFGKDWAKQAFS